MRTDPPATPRSWCELEIPVGQLVLAGGPSGLVEVAFVDARERDGFARSLGPALPDEPLMAQARRELDEYFAGTRTAFTVPLDRPASGTFHDAARDALLGIEVGTTITYTELARRAGRPAAVRAAASACATNPLPIVVPCHRVLRSDGSLGGYLGGLDAKRWLIEHEARLTGRAATLPMPAAGRRPGR